MSTPFSKFLKFLKGQNLFQNFQDLKGQNLLQSFKLTHSLARSITHSFTLAAGWLSRGSILILVTWYKYLRLVHPLVAHE